MTPERRAYAEERVASLTAKAALLQQSVVSFQGRVFSFREAEERRAVQRQLVSTNTSLKRWRKELAQP